MVVKQHLRVVLSRLEISSTFYAHIFCQYFGAKNYKAARKMLVKLTIDWKIRSLKWFIDSGSVRNFRDLNHTQQKSYKLATFHFYMLQINFSCFKIRYFSISMRFLIYNVEPLQLGYLACLTHMSIDRFSLNGTISHAKKFWCCLPEKGWGS